MAREWRDGMVSVSSQTIEIITFNLLVAQVAPVFNIFEKINKYERLNTTKSGNYAPLVPLYFKT